ncbi:MAG: hypothetical protein A3B47_02285 [Candidatus Levybacteria bacterium RIFCSPLOWO2_01_FULL_39_24]|nr:MAG: hypothetical protein A3B47_02285 [Candidatus Levybacteria bacterium RIFCSPLOWO2_01_FULL_39_24]
MSVMVEKRKNGKNHNRFVIPEENIGLYKGLSYQVGIKAREGERFKTHSGPVIVDKGHLGICVTKTNKDKKKQ